MLRMSMALTGHDARKWENAGRNFEKSAGSDNSCRAMRRPSVNGTPSARHRQANCGPTSAANRACLTLYLGAIRQDTLKCDFIPNLGRPPAGDRSASELAKSPALRPLPAELSFEAALKELESIVARMETGELALEDSIEAYKRGVLLVRAAQERLEVAEQQVRILDEGVLKPLLPDAEER